MSFVISSEGSCLNSSQLHLLGSSISPTMQKSHSSRGVRGVGPAESTGKPSTKYWPGGSAVSWLLRRPKKPREKNPSPMLYTSLVFRLYSSALISRGARSVWLERRHRRYEPEARLLNERVGPGRIAQRTCSLERNLSLLLGV